MTIIQTVLLGVVSGICTTAALYLAGLLFKNIYYLGIRKI